MINLKFAEYAAETAAIATDEPSKAKVNWMAELSEQNYIDLTRDEQ